MMVGLCRLCAAVRKMDLLIPITASVCQKLKECFAMEMCQHGDKLPKRVCVICMETLQNTFLFFKKVQESQESLTLLFDDPNKESIDNVSEVSMLLNEVFDTQSDTIVAAANLGKQEAAKSTETNDENTAAGHSPRFNLDMVVEYTEDDEVELYQTMDIEADIRDSSLAQESNCLGGEETNELSHSSEEVETYFLDEESDEELEQRQEEVIEQLKPNKVKEIKSINHSIIEPPVIEILNAAYDNNINSKCLAAVEINKTVQQKWSSYIWSCFSCSETCDSFLALILHCQENHNIISANYMQFKCTDCQKICAHYHKFLNHVRFRHHTALILRCDVCDVLKESYSKLALHREKLCEASHSYPSVSLCNVCGKSFHTRKATLTHVRFMHNDDNNDDVKWYQCDKCEKKFKRIGSLRAHEQVHSGLKEFACDICDRKFRQKNNLEVHLYTHINEKSFECKVCKKSLKTSASLEKHQLIHMDIKKFTCDYCQKEFRTKDEKLSHERIHTGEKPFKCTYCGRSFRFRSILLGHVIGHTGESPYSCTDCDRQFTNWSNWNKHINRCHKHNSDDANVFELTPS